jgi:carboxyl-terminal processing protease
MQTNFWKYILITIAIFIVIGGSFSGGFLVGQAMPLFNSTTIFDQNPLVDSIGSTNTSEEDLDALFLPFWEAWDYVDNMYIDQPVDHTKMMQGAISGMLESLGDEHTSYMDPEMFRIQNTPLQGEYEGIGAWVDTTGDYLTIISPMPESPAEEAGLKSEDQVIAVDDVSVDGMDGNQVLRKILGEAGTQVKLTIFRPATSETLDFSIIRKKIEVPSVTSEMLDNQIAYIQLVNFGDKTHNELKDQLQDLLKDNPVGLILDLRYNGGGYLTTAIDVTSEFVKQSPLMIEEYGNGEKTTFNSKTFGLARDIPLVVLVNEGSASASEITAGAIQDYGRGILVGTQTYGKGSVQNWITLQDDQGGIRVTIAHWLTPNGRLIAGQGLIPDYEVQITEEDMKNEFDSQLEKAIELLLNP